MSAVFRICPRCRIRICDNGYFLATSLATSLANTRNAAAQHSAVMFARAVHRSQSRSYTTAEDASSPEKIAATLAEPGKPGKPRKPRAEGELAPVLEDPVVIRMEAERVAAKERRRPKAVTTTDVEMFLSKVQKKRHGQDDDTIRLTPSEEDAKTIDQRYAALLGYHRQSDNSHAKRKPRLAPLPGGESLKSKFIYPAATHVVSDIPKLEGGQPVVLHGFIKRVRKMNKYLTFLKFYDYHSGPREPVQLVSQITEESSDEQKAMHSSLHKLPPLAPVCVSGAITFAVVPPPPKDSEEAKVLDWKPKPEIQVDSLVQLNSVSPDLIYTPSTVFPPEKRHLQLRTSFFLAHVLRKRSQAAAMCRRMLGQHGFLEVETPLLFKSTPEGAREFLVPTRNGSGMCYALPQSPQQYKQILMASGVPRYYQFAKCFRDEDLRADRQPEFTQLDMEMSFARGEDVMRIIEELLRELWYRLVKIKIPQEFRRMSYYEAMSKYGTDKPDLRFAHYKIRKLDLRGKRFDMFKLPISGITDADLAKMHAFHEKFVTEYQGRQEKDRFMSYVADERTANGVPEHNFAASDVEEINEQLEVQRGDLVILQARPGRFLGGSTIVGAARAAVIKEAIAAGLIEKPIGYCFVWITGFPLFTASGSESEPGQSGTAGLASTHHPFTAPHEDDFHLLDTAPEQVRAENYDIVVNGVELGGGSRRIHDPALQRYILEEVIKVHPDKIHQFDHLIDVLGSGCPPHAGIALGFDRLVAVMMNTENVRDVIAFPKNSKGVDPLAGSPSLMSDADLEMYRLKKMPE